MDLLTVLSYAKINLGLRILDKRKDGYHDIITVFQQVDLHDKITFKKMPSSIRVTSTDPTLPKGEDNLVFQSLELYRKKHDIQQGLEVHIQKNIPVGAGLGGGSSNAAAALLAANQIWNTNLSRNELLEMAAAIGSDVSFFLIGGTVIGEGRGEILTSIQWPTDWWIVIVYPGFGVPTAQAYGEIRITLTKEEKFTKFKSIFNRYKPHALQEELKNDLEGVVFRRHPVLREIKEQMYRRDAFYASMSGSGSSVYGLFLRREHAEAASLFFSSEMRMDTFLCRPIPSSS